jgi:hypothetical protein
VVRHLNRLASSNVFNAKLTTKYSAFLMLSCSIGLSIDNGFLRTLLLSLIFFMYFIAARDAFVGVTSLVVSAFSVSTLLFIYLRIWPTIEISVLAITIFILGFAVFLTRYVFDPISSESSQTGIGVYALTFIAALCLRLLGPRSLEQHALLSSAFGEDGAAWWMGLSKAQDGISVGLSSATLGAFGPITSVLSTTIYETFSFGTGLTKLSDIPAVLNSTWLMLIVLSFFIGCSAVYDYCKNSSLKSTETYIWSVQGGLLAAIGTSLFILNNHLTAGVTVFFLIFSVWIVLRSGLGFLVVSNRNQFFVVALFFLPLFTWYPLMPVAGVLALVLAFAFGSNSSISIRIAYSLVITLVLVTIFITFMGGNPFTGLRRVVAMGGGTLDVGVTLWLIPFVALILFLTTIVSREIGKAEIFLRLGIWMWASLMAYLAAIALISSIETGNIESYSARKLLAIIFSSTLVTIPIAIISLYRSMNFADRNRVPMALLASSLSAMFLLQSGSPIHLLISSKWPVPPNLASSGNLWLPSLMQVVDEYPNANILCANGSQLPNSTESALPRYEAYECTRFAQSITGNQGDGSGAGQWAYAEGDVNGAAWKLLLDSADNTNASGNQASGYASADEYFESKAQEGYFRNSVIIVLGGYLSNPTGDSLHQRHLVDSGAVVVFTSN